MKKIFTLCVACLVFLSLYAQQENTPEKKYDTVKMKSGETKVGSVTDITDDVIRFVHKGETLNYAIKKNDIEKIIFSSGRVEMYSDPSTDKKVDTSNAEHHNKVAVLPFSYINNQQRDDPEMGYKVQGECYTFLSSKAIALNIQNPVTTNALMGKAGITTDNFRNYTMTEICGILGVEYIVKGMVTSNMTNTTTSGSTTYDSKSSSSKSDKTSKTDKSSSGNVYGSSTTQPNFKTSVLMEIYTDDNKKIFGQDRTSFWSSVDAYKSTIQYLLKKTPIYGK